MMRAYFYNHQNLQSFTEELQALVGAPVGKVSKVELSVEFTAAEWSRHALDIRELVNDYAGRLLYA